MHVWQKWQRFGLKAKVATKPQTAGCPWLWSLDANHRQKRTKRMRRCCLSVPIWFLVTWGTATKKLPRQIHFKLQGVQSIPVTEALGVFVKGSQPTRRENKHFPKGIRKMEKPAREGQGKENADLPLIPPSGVGCGDCATFARDKTPRDKESRDF